MDIFSFICDGANSHVSPAQRRCNRAVPTHQVPTDDEEAIIGSLVERVTIGSDAIRIRFAESDQAPGDPTEITISWRPTPFRRKREVIQPADGVRPIRAEARTKLLAAIANGRRWLDEIVSDPAATVESIAAREALPERSARSILSLAFLAPDIVKAAVAGTLPRGFGVSRLIDLPTSWVEQRKALGLSPRS